MGKDPNSRYGRAKRSSLPGDQAHAFTTCRPHSPVPRPVQPGGPAGYGLGRILLKQCRSLHQHGTYRRRDHTRSLIPAIALAAKYGVKMRLKRRFIAPLPGFGMRDSARSIFAHALQGYFKESSRNQGTSR